MADEMMGLLAEYLNPKPAGLLSMSGMDQGRALAAISAGLLSGRNWGEGLSAALQGAGQAVDGARERQRQELGARLKMAEYSQEVAKRQALREQVDQIVQQRPELRGLVTEDNVGDIVGKMAGNIIDPQAPKTAGGMMWNPQSGQFEAIPGYEEMQARIRAAGRAPDAPYVPTAAKDLNYWTSVLGQAQPGSTTARVAQANIEKLSGAGDGQGGPFAGTGMAAQDRNTLITIGPKIQDGTATPQERQAYGMAYQSLQKPKRYEMNGQWYEEPGMDVSMFPGLEPAAAAAPMAQPQAGGQAPAQQSPSGSRPIGTPEAKPLSSEVAGKVALTRQALDSMPDVRGLVFDQNNTLNRRVLAEVASGVTVSTEAKKLYSLAYQLADARLRVVTGAEAPRAEVEAQAKAMIPGPLDSAESARLKLDSMERFYREFLGTQNINPPAAAGGDGWSIRRVGS